MTVEKCLNYCGTNGYTYAGLKNKSTCSCGNNINTSKFSSSYACDLACDGDPASFCGAVNRIAVYSGSGPVSLPTTTAGPTATTTTKQATTTTPSGAQQTHYEQCGGKGVSTVYPNMEAYTLTLRFSTPALPPANRLTLANTLTTMPLIVHPDENDISET
ncbi:hypothetical protein FRB90_009423 [Tulasnella sp. 427]|nr:hypothetical protein FRB90_009423 [Tulasnella sp. 427]